MKKRIILILLVVFYAVSCIEYTAKFQINLDGSGTLDLTYIIQKSLLEHSALSKFHNNKFIPTTKEEVLAQYKNKPGVTLLETDIKDVDKINKKIHLKLHFDNVKDLNDSGMNYSWKIENNKYTFNILLKSISAPQKNAGSQLTDQLVKRTMSRYKITFKAILPRKVVDTNADEIDWNTVTWKVNLYEMTHITKPKRLYASIQTHWWELVINWFKNLFKKILSIF